MCQFGIRRLKPKAGEHLSFQNGVIFTQVSFPMYLRADLYHDFFSRAKRENITKIENKASLHKVEHGLFKQQFSHFPMNINSIANQTYNKKREIQYTLKVENKVGGEALAKRLSLDDRDDSKSNLCFLSVQILIKKPNTSGFYF